jgi:hypothetical protein
MDEAPSLFARIAFSYRLDGAGWATATISNGVNDREMTVSYLSDALGDLTWAVAKLLEGSPQQICEWMDEPGRWRWKMTRQGEALDLLILRVDDPVRGIPNQRINVFFQVNCKLRQFANQLNNQLWKLHNEHGPEGYLQLWQNNRFPSDAWQRLTAAISQTSA